MLQSQTYLFPEVIINSLILSGSDFTAYMHILNAYVMICASRNLDTYLKINLNATFPKCMRKIVRAIYLVM